MRRVLIEVRERAGLSQQEVAEAVGISRPFYTLIERGSRNPSLPVALRIARLFDADPGDLFSPPAAHRATPPPQNKRRIGGGRPCHKR